MSGRTNKEISIRVISVLFAVVLWLYVASEQNPMEYRNIKDVPVRLINKENLQQSGLVIKDGENQKVDIILQGKRGILSEIKPNDIYVEADLRGFSKRGVNTVPVEVKGLPANVELVDVTPRHVKVTLEPIVAAQIPVKVITEGSLQEGYKALETKVTPSEVLVKGPESLLNGIEVVTATLKLEGVKSDIKEVLPVKVVDRDDNEMAGLQVSPDIVEVSVEVVRTKEVPVEIVLEGQPVTGKEITGISLSRDSIVIYGEEELVESIDRIRTKPININDIHDDESYSVELVVPEGVIIEGNINTITVYVEVESRLTRAFEIEEVSFNNMPRGLKASGPGNLTAVKVTVEGKESIINRLKVEDIIVYGDLEGINRGKHTVPLAVKLPAGVTLKSISPDKIDVELVPINRGD